MKFAHSGVFLALLTTAAAGQTLQAPASPQASPYFFRFEVGASRLASDRGSWIGPGPADPRVFHSLSHETAPYASVALGFEPFRGIRGEVAFSELFPTSVSGTWIYSVPFKPGPHADMATQVNSHLLMANAYLEPLKIAGINWPVQPFFGGGLGVAFNDMASWTRTNPAAAGQVVRKFAGATQEHFAWNLAAGVSVDLQPWTSLPGSLQLTYRYTDAGEVQGGSAPYVGNSVPRDPFSFPLRYHAFTVGYSVPIGSAAPVVRGGTGNDLPVAAGGKGNPIYVAICPGYGAGFFLVPGTSTCLAIDGQVRAEYGYFQDRGPPGASTTGMLLRSDFGLDARTPTEWGTLRTVFRPEIVESSGVFSGTSGETAQQTHAFIQWAGLTAGLLQSPFDFYADAINFGYIGGSNTTSPQLTYTMNLGAGYSATVGIEDRASRVTANGGNLVYGGQSTPNAVGVLHYGADSGPIQAAQLSIAVNQINAIGATNPYPQDVYGLATQAGVRIRTPLFARNDSLWLQAAYSRGNLSYVGANNVPTRIGFLSLGQADGVVLNNQIVPAIGYGLTAAFLHYWSPSVSQAFFASYVGTRYPALAWTDAGLSNSRIYQAGSNIVWAPVRNLQLGAELLYTRLESAHELTAANGALLDKESQITARLRVQRSF